MTLGRSGLGRLAEPGGWLRETSKGTIDALHEGGITCNAVMRDNLGDGNDGNDLVGREDDERAIIVVGGSAVVGWCSLGELGDSRDCSDEGG